MLFDYNYYYSFLLLDFIYNNNYNNTNYDNSTKLFSILIY